MSILRSVREFSDSSHYGEAAVQVMDRLLLLRKKSKSRSWCGLASRLGLSARTLERWEKAGKLPPHRIPEICREFGWEVPAQSLSVKLSGPRDFSRALKCISTLDTELRYQLDRQLVGYAAVWLASRLVGRDLELSVECMLGSKELPVSRVAVLAERGIPNAHIQFSVKNREMLYQAYSHTPSQPAELVFEGAVDMHAFDFCIDYLKFKTRKPTRKAAEINKKIRAEISKHHERNRIPFNHAPGSW